jgi:hypothetical protein
MYKERRGMKSGGWNLPFYEFEKRNSLEYLQLASKRRGIRIISIHNVLRNSCASNFLAYSDYDVKRWVDSRHRRSFSMFLFRDILFDEYSVDCLRPNQSTELKSSSSLYDGVALSCYLAVFLACIEWRLEERQRHNGIVGCIIVLLCSYSALFFVYNASVTEIYYDPRVHRSTSRHIFSFVYTIF